MSPVQSVRPILNVSDVRGSLAWFDAMHSLCIELGLGHAADRRALGNS
jgi:hypothetical protein